MTTIETLTLSQVQSLNTEAAQAGDMNMVDDCNVVETAYCESEAAAL